MKRLEEFSLRVRTTCAIALGLVVLASCASPTNWIARVPVGAQPILDDRFPERVVQFAGGVEARADITYATIEGFRPLTLDLYSPQRSGAGPFPLIVFVHGGAWRAGHSRHSGALENFPALLADISARGYVVASINYRLSGEARFPGPVQDLRQAIRWLRSKSNLYQIDPERVVVWGASAGGHLAALDALACEEARFDAQVDPRQSRSTGEDCVQGLVLWYAPSNFAPLAAAQASDERTPEAVLLGCALRSCPADLLRLASPSFHASADDPPVLLLHGSEDLVVDFAQSRDLADRLGAASVQVTLAPLEGVGHSFIGSSPEATRAATIAALELTIAFIDDVVTPAR